ncbi:MAG: class I SAM-dependent methyltransferase [Lentisphaeraceae bacterium]|nr:class I SAM-dependent methyltransferase [Lentisphaeraceae bacterium]
MNDNLDCERYWDETSVEYQQVTRISLDDFHYGPLLPGESKVKALPPITKGMKCLEIGSGAGQNSIYLASLGAECLATDISGEQLKHGEELAKGLGLKLSTRRAGLDEINKEEFGTFDFIHTTWAMPFAQDQQKVIQNCAAMLNPGGHLLITTGHPIFAGEWIVLDEFEEGLFLSNYFEPPGEVRFTKDEENFVRTEQFPISTYTNWILDSGLQLTKMLELEPIQLPILSEQEIVEQTPYDSPVWRDMYKQIKNVPFVVTYIAKK